MSAVLVAVDQDAASQIERLRSVGQWVMGSDAADAFETSDKAAKARAYLKAVNGAAAVAREATRLECICYRRLGQMGEASLLPKGERRHIAVLFASMSDADFEGWLQEAGPWSGAIGVSRMVGRAARDQEDRDRGFAIGSGGGASTPVCDERTLATLADAASALLSTYTDEDVPFTVSDVAGKLAEDYDCFSNGAARAGYREAVRLAMAMDTSDGECVHPDAPGWVTYEEDDLGWVRVPFHSASIDQFAAMVELRRLQASQSAAVASRLERLLSELREAVPFAGDDARCGRLSMFSYAPEAQVAS